MVRNAGQLYKPTDVIPIVANDAVYVVEQLNHRISKWSYLPLAPSPENFIFNIDAGRITAITVSGGGSMYSVDDPVIISPPTNPNVTGVNATAVVATLTGDAILTVRVTNQGTGYETTNLPTINAPTAGTPATFNDAVIATPWGNNNDGTTGAGLPVSGVTDNALDHPTGIAHDSVRLYVTDTNHNRLRTINPATGAFLGSVGTGGFGDTNFYHPSGVETNVVNSRVVVADELNNRAIAFMTGVTPTFTNVLPAPTPESFIRPRGVIFDTVATPDRYDILDKQRGLVSVYNDVGFTFLSQTGTPGAGDAASLRLYSPSGGHGNGIANAFANTLNNNLLEVDANAVVPAFTGAGIGTGDGDLHSPESVTVFADTSLYVLVANTGNHRIEVYTESGGVLTFRSNFGSPLA